ncbi:MAG: macro domain-containing protein [Aggregatilineales bacterium]
MITYITGDLFQSSAQVLVNPVNTVGVMGRGLAKVFKQKYPEMFTEYQQRCKSGDFDVDDLHLYRTSDKWILNFPTKKHWRGKSKLEYIEAGLQKFVDIYETENITSAAFPQLGCGLGGLDWNTQVRPLVKQYLQDLPIDIYVYSL